MLKWIIAVVGLFCSLSTFAGGIEVIEGAPAEALREKNKDALFLVQKQKTFYLRTPDGKEQKKPKELKLKVGEIFFIVNEEEKVLHNVYDTTDSSWVLRKQEPNGIAAITFNKAGKHELRCAIHPKMRIKVVIE